MRYYIIAGEASGDLHGSNLIKEIKKLDENAVIRCWGGDLMESAGATLVKHYRELAFMGFAEVIANIRTILNNLSFCKKDIISFQTDVLILIDYPGFNLRIAEFAYHHGIKVDYYISPQIWAWKQSRVKQIKKHVNNMYVILPFEKDFYAKFNYKVEFVGHPLLDAISQFKNNAKQIKFEKPVIALLPGSRMQEIKKILPLMLDAAKTFTDYQIVIAGAPSISDDIYKKFCNNYDVEIIYNQTYSLLSVAKAALVTSGTATLETALFEVPEVVCYKGGAISYQIAKKLINVKYISLVNLVMDKEIVKELIQNELNTTNLIFELNKIIFDTEYRAEISKNYTLLKEKLGGEGASANTANLIYKDLIIK